MISYLVIRNPETGDYYTGKYWDTVGKLSKKIKEAKHYETKEEIALDLLKTPENKDTVFTLLGVGNWELVDVMMKKIET
jgi:hypothetical protein